MELREAVTIERIIAMADVSTCALGAVMAIFVQEDKVARKELGWPVPRSSKVAAADVRAAAPAPRMPMPPARLCMPRCSRRSGARALRHA